MHQFLAAIFLPVVEFYLLQRSIGVERNGSMEEQVVVVDGVHASVGEHGAHVSL